MKKKVVSFAAAALLGFVAAQSAFAEFAQSIDQGKVNFKGELTTNTCTIDADSKDQIVQLPRVSTSALAARGNVAGSTSFEIKVSKCAAEVNKVAAHFEMENVDPDTLTLKNEAAGDGAATNVSVQLVNSDGTALPVGSTGRFFDVSGTEDARGATMIYGGQYYALDKTTAGKVESHALFTLAYE
ncbi:MULTISPECIES: fimbrial protein [Burkholderia]|uniref:Fimbrial protein n=1 Tax=Burkholderia savannae TaxID=1637837 RepID=A0ABR5T230_9BURK|nr:MULTISPECIES: fimbrial protein [Burkholderia]AOJ72698.1 fimbrial protein [Burkholderia savannae]AOJ84766.1 fimbrial protein [Burkholderia savannae]KGS04080.1 fimbrial family protein [Burkholderia sp. ABCPW 111]KVG45069.1 fimbrial protein [Burkholderia sp. MSMB0265]KVG90059.1 fimbrial protein [Burkholderia sp. MSMB2040]